MLVISAYFSALSPNEPIRIIINFSGLVITLTLILPISAILKPRNFTSSSLPSYANNPLITLFTPFNVLILLFLAVLLFVALVAVVKIAIINKGPLRPFDYV